MDECDDRVLPSPGGSLGVYLISDESMGLLSNGKASMHSTLGARMSSYFQYEKDDSCRIVHGWERSHHMWPLYL